MPSRRRRRLLLFLLVLHLLLLLASSTSRACRQSDRQSLLLFSSGISASPPLNWRSSSAADCCFWEGVGCDDGRVTRLQLPSRRLVGNISFSFPNLTRLTHLNLSHNSLYGSLPVAFFPPLDGLEIIDLSYNSVSGELPLTLSPKVQVLDISSNTLEGEIRPSFFQQAWNLTSFNASNNSFSGSIPSSICSSIHLRVLDFSFNKFGGNIPSRLGECARLEVFRAGFNFLTGEIPGEIYGASTIREISVPANELHGQISGRIVRLVRLRVLELYSNRLNGKIPPEIGKLSDLEYLLLHMNNLTGNLPSDMANCSNLVVLNLQENNFSGELSGFDFSKLLRLEMMDLGANNFSGRIPPSLYSCKSLNAVRLAMNQLQGQIPHEISLLQSLTFFSISKNKLTNLSGSIRSLMKCENLTTLILSRNFLGEALPDDEILSMEAAGFRNLQVFSLGACRLEGQVPVWLAKLKELQVLDLSYNHITGSIPGWLGTLPNLFYIDLSFNLITGLIPKEFSRIPALKSEQAVAEVKRSYLELPVFVAPNNATKHQYKHISNLPPAIYLRNNNLSGSIPLEISHLKCLHVLDLSFNKLSGSIPSQLSNLTNLERLDLSGNRLSGQIPITLTSLNFLSLFRVANNNLEGPIPLGGQFSTFTSDCFYENPGLCGSVLRRPCPDQSPGPARPTTTRKNPKMITVVGIILGISSGMGIVLTLLALWVLSKRKILHREDLDKQNLDAFSCNSNSMVARGEGEDSSLVIVFPNNKAEMKDLTISDILEATDNFNQENVVGCGGFGLVYKAKLADGRRVAIKKLSGDMGLMDREFRAEVEALSTAQHENLVSLQGYCIHEGFRLLIYSYMENGSLDYWLHEKIDTSSQLDWPTRLKIMKGASCGLAYMHQICEPHIVHRDIKSSNILLNDKFEAHLADFGLSRLILPYHTHVTTELVGTLGYIPPEYGQAWVATLRGDIYSLGVVMLELLTGRRPYQVLKQRITRELVTWVQQMRCEGKEDKIFDPLLEGQGFEEEMLQVLDVACMCVNQNPLKRPTIKVVVDWLENVGVNTQMPK